MACQGVCSEENKKILTLAKNSIKRIRVSSLENSVGLSIMSIPLYAGWSKLGINLVKEPTGQHLALGTIRGRFPLETSLSFETDAILMCLRSQGRIRIRAVLLGVLIGLGLAGFVVMWTHVRVSMKQKPTIRHNTGKRTFFVFSNDPCLDIVRNSLLQKEIPSNY